MKKLLLFTLLFIVLTLSSCKGETEIEELIEFKMNDGIDTVEINTQWIDAGIELSSDSFSFTIYSSDHVDTSTLGLYEINYSKEYNNVTYTKTRYVMVTDQTPPQMELCQGIDTVTLNSEWEYMGVNVTDNSLEVLTYSISGIVDTSVVGVYEIVYTATDSSGNTTQLTRYITVIDN